MSVTSQPFHIVTYKLCTNDNRKNNNFLKKNLIELMENFATLHNRFFLFIFNLKKYYIGVMTDERKSELLFYILMRKQFSNGN